MKLIWHIVWKDLRSERWSILFWAALFLGQAGLGLIVFRHDGGDRDWQDTVRACNVVLVAMQFVTGFILVVRLVQADALSGTRMFWRTRPIPPERLGRAKVLGAVLLVGILPVLLRLPWWIYCGFAPGDAAWAAVDTLGWQAVVIAPAFLIASLTDDLSRAMMWGLILVTVLLAGVLFLQAKSGAGAALLYSMLNESPRRVGGLFFTRIWLAGFLLVTGSTAIAMHQFMTRHVVRSLALTLALAGVIVSAAQSWPWDCTILLTQINDPAPSGEPAGDSYPDLHLKVGPARVQGPDVYELKRSYTWIQQNVELDGLPDGVFLNHSTLRQEWHWPDSPDPIEQKFNFVYWSDRALRGALALPGKRGDPETAQWLRQRYADQVSRGQPTWPSYLIWEPETEPLAMTGRARLPDDLVARIRAQPPAGEARFEFELARGHKRLEFPLQPGARWSGSSRAYRVGAVDKTGTLAFVQLMTARPGVRANGLWSADVVDTIYRAQNDYSDGLILLNRHDNTIGSTSRSGNTERSGRVIVGGVDLQWYTLHANSARVIRNGQWVAADQNWPDHSTLVAMTVETVARFTRELQVERYELLPGPLEKPGAEREKKDIPRKI